MYEILKDFSLLRIEGKNAQIFVNRFTTNDLINNQYSYNFFLNSKGRYLSDSFIFVENTDLLFLETHNSQRTRLIEHLNFYKLNQKIEITDLSNSFFIIYSTNMIEKDLALYSKKDSRYYKMCFRSAVYRDKSSSIEKNNLYEKDLYVHDKYRYSIIDGYLDLIYNKSIPLEFAGEQLNAISFTKGCYLGQELISRVKTQGVIRKKIYQVISDKDITFLEVPYVLKYQGEKIGLLCSYYKKLAIGLMNINIWNMCEWIEDPKIRFKIEKPPWFV